MLELEAHICATTCTRTNVGRPIVTPLPLFLTGYPTPQTPYLATMIYPPLDLLLHTLLITILHLLQWAETVYDFTPHSIKINEPRG